MSGSNEKLMVAAIDIGTTYSGYAHSSKYDYMNDPMKICVNQIWIDGSGLCTLKAPNVVLFDPRGNFDSFGYDAERKYADLATDDYHKGWKYFRHFKMELHDQVVFRREMKLYDDQRNTMPAIDVFAATIKYLTDHLITRLTDRAGILATNIYWVLTVPAIWQDSAKQFMRTAAVMAGIPDAQLTLALEPEAAALYCKELGVSNSESEHLQLLNPGAQFMVLDLGGGTVDITVHEVLDNGSLKELCPPSGGAWGGIEVNKCFDEFLDKLFGSNVMRKFKNESTFDYLDLQRDIELNKRTCKDIADGKFRIRIPVDLYKFYEEEEGEAFDKGLKKGAFANCVINKNSKLAIKNDIVLKMFKKSKECLVKHVEMLLRKPELRNVSMLMMVGGFSESEIMRNAVKGAFTNKQVIVPEDAGLAVIKGAVMYGHNPYFITSRRLKYTYGKRTEVPFDERRHPESKKVFRDGQYKCKDIFKVFIEAGTTVEPTGITVEHTFTATSIDTSSATVEIYRSKSHNPMFVSDDGCSRVGEITIDLSRRPSTSPKIIDVQMFFGGTELRITANERGTNVFAHLQCLI